MAQGHEYHVEEGFLHYVVHGEITEADMATLIEHGETASARLGGYWLLADVRKMGPIGAAARRLAAQNPRSYVFQGAAIVGASVVNRAVVTLIARAMVLMGRSHIDIRFFPSEAEARAWLATKTIVK